MTRSARTKSTAIWNMITNGAFYHEPGADFYTRLNPDKAKSRALDPLRKMRYAVTHNPWSPRGNSESSRQRGTDQKR